jgi:hypothetical protein
MRTEKELQQRREAQKRYRERHPERCKEIQLRSERKCKDRVNAGHRRRYHQHLTRDIIRKYRRELGVNEQRYDEMLISQSGRCAVCLEPMKVPCLDHNHVTREVRELLCRFCNLVLGNADDKIAVLERAIGYLRKHGVSNGKETPPVQSHSD